MKTPDLSPLQGRNAACILSLLALVCCLPAAGQEDANAAEEPAGAETAVPVEKEKAPDAEADAALRGEVTATAERLLEPDLYYRDDVVEALTRLQKAGQVRIDPQISADPAALHQQLEKALLQQAISRSGARFLAASSGAPDEMAAMLLTLNAAARVRFGVAEPAKLWPHWDEGDTPGLNMTTGRADYLVQLVESHQEKHQSIVPLLLVEEATPSNRVYDGLRSAWEEGRHTVDQDQQAFQKLPPLKDGQLVKVGQPYEHAGLLAERLQQQGYLAPASRQSDQVTEEMAEALKKFQETHALMTDGVLGPNTWRLLNLTPMERHRSLELNMGRARLLPDEPGERHLIVNLPGGTVYAWEGGALAQSMKVVFGAASDNRQTPVFRDEMELVIFRPYWNVPISIAKNEIVPATMRNPGYFGRRNYELVRSFGTKEQALPLTAYNLQQAAEGRLHIRQRPGNSNALGLVKFLFPNDYAIYLHDTPEDQLFNRTQRDFSHGCIRLEDPGRMAQWVLGWPEDKVTDAMHSEAHKGVNVESPIPVYITYFTAFPEPLTEDGKVRYFVDIYEKDEAASELIFGPRAAPIEVTEAAEAP